MNIDPFSHYLHKIRKLHEAMSSEESQQRKIKSIDEGGAKLTTPRGHEGLTTDMKGRWTIGAFDTKHANKKETPAMKEAVYGNNAGIMEVFKFFEVANDEQKKQFDDLVNNGNQNAALKLVEKVLGIKFQGDLTL